MKDLKHLIYFENLLENNENELIHQAKQEGRKCLGTICYQLPEVLLNLPGCFSVRLRAPRTASVEMGSYYMTSLSCEYCRAVLERALEGGYGFLDCIFDAYACSQMTSCVENIAHLKLIERDNPDFFVQHIDTPMKADENGVRHMVRMCRSRVLDKLEEEYGIDVSDDALRTAVEEHNHICRLLNEIGSYRKLDNPTITGYEYAVLCLATYVAPKDLLLPKLEETAEELKTREPDAKPGHRVKVVLAGSEVDDPAFVKLIEESGALIVADRHCFGTVPGRLEIPLNDEEDVLTQICRFTVEQCQCPRYMDSARIAVRKKVLDELARENHADGIVMQQMSFCNFWPYERAGMTHILTEQYGWPVLSIEHSYVNGVSGQMRTRVQAFVESIEIKKIQGGGQA